MADDKNNSQNKIPGFETQAIHGGLHYQEGTGAVIPPMYLTSTFAAGNAEGFDYTRSGNPNFKNLEAVLAGVDHARHATVFASGVAAITAVVSTLKSGDWVVAEENIYGCTYRLFAQVFEKFGVSVEYTDLTDPENYNRITERKPALVWLESPTNPLLKIVDIQAIADIAHGAGSQVVVDNTFASSYLENQGDSSFAMMPLPTYAQLAPVYSIIALDYNHDGNLDLALFGNSYSNFYAEGNLDAFRGLVLRGNGENKFGLKNDKTRTSKRTELNDIKTSGYK